MPTIPIQLEKIAENLSLNRPTLGIMYFIATADFTLSDVLIKRSVTSGLSGLWYFNVRINGAAVFSGGGRPTLSLGVPQVSKTGLSVSVAKGDAILFDLEVPGGGILTGSLSLVLTGTQTAAGVGDVTGAASSTSNNLAQFNDTSGKAIKDGGLSVSDDTTLASDSSTQLATVHAVKGYVDANAGSGSVVSVIAGDGIDVDDTDPANPIISFTPAITTDGTLSGDSDSNIPTEKAVKKYVDDNAGGGGGGASALTDLTDVDVSGVSDGDVLTYDSGDGKWKANVVAGGSMAETTSTVTTLSLTNNQEETGTVPLGRTSTLSRMAADRACRVRLYMTSATRTADASRPIGTDPTGGGLICEVVFTTSETVLGRESAVASNGDPVRSNDIYYSIQNLSGSTSTVTVQIPHVILEA